MVVVAVNEAVDGRYVVRRVTLPSRGVESWTVVGPDRRPVEAVDAFLGWLTWIERSPNTVEAYARDLKLFWTFLAARGLAWEAVTVAELGEFAAWARRPAENVVVLSEQAARRCARTVNRMLTAVVGFYEYQGRRGNRLARELVVQTRGGRGDYKARLAAAGAGTSHCPSSNAFLGSGLFPMRRHLEHGVRVALGTDVGAGTAFSLFNEGLMAYLGQMLRPDGRRLGPADLLYLATRAGAEMLALGDEVGDFTPGKSADTVLIRPPEGQYAAGGPQAQPVARGQPRSHLHARAGDERRGGARRRRGRRAAGRRLNCGEGSAGLGPPASARPNT